MRIINLIMLIFVPFILIAQETTDLSSFTDTMYLDKSTGNYIVKFSGYTENDLDTLITMTFIPPNKIDPIVNAKVNYNSDSLYYLYNYKITNGQSAVQELFKFTVYFNTDDIEIKNKQTNKWHGGRYIKRYQEIGWWGDGGLEPTWSADGFAISSKSLPGIGFAGGQGTGQMISYSYGEPDGEITDKLLGMSIGKSSFVLRPTVIPVKILTPFSYLGFLDTLINYTDSSYTFGWIKNEQTRDKYNNYFAVSKNYLDQNNKFATKKELNKVIADCNIDSSSVLTSEAYALLYFNTQYLLTKIEEDIPENNLSGSVKVVVTNPDSINTFGYTITNNDTSKQAIKNIYVENSSIVQAVNLPASWTSINNLAAMNLVGFNTQSSGILSGAAQSGYAVSTTGLPAIGNVYLQSGRSTVDTADIFGNSYVVETIVPTSKPEVFNPNEFVDTLIYYNNKSLSNNWLTAEWVKNVFESSLNNAKLFIGQKQYTSAVPVMQQLITILDSYKISGFVKDEAYALLKYNAEYLIEHIQD